VLHSISANILEAWDVNHGDTLTQLLLRNSAHELRTPLNMIVNYLEEAIESSPDSKTQEHLRQTRVASESLLHAIVNLIAQCSTSDVESNVAQGKVEVASIS